MNAVLKMVVKPTLVELQADLAAAKERLAAVQETQDKLKFVDHEVDAARTELMNFASGEAAAIKAWVNSGCHGLRPQPDLARHEVLEKRLHQAMLSAGNSCTARDTLAVRAAAAREEIREISD